MITIGLRVYSNSKIYYCILEQSSITVNYLDISYLNVPKSLNWPEALNFIRNTILDILIEYKVNNAIIRICEFGFRLNTSLVERNYIEGILQETLASSSVEKFLAGQISEFASLLTIPRSDFKKYANAQLTFTNGPTTQNWSTFSLEERETILTANAAINL